MRSLFACAAAALVLGACAGGASGRYVDETYGYESSRTGDSRSLTINRIGTYTSSNIQEPRRLIIRSDQEFRDFWYDANLGSPPSVDFGQNMVIAVSSGSRPTTGHSVLVNDVRLEEDGTLRVAVVESRPGRNCVTGQQMTLPVDVVVVPKVDLRTWSFNDRREERDC